MEYGVAREALLHARRANMNNGDYLFIIIELESNSLEYRLEHSFKWYVTNYNKGNSKEKAIEDNNAVKEMLLNTLILTRKLIDMTSQTRYEKYIRELKCRRSELPFYTAIYKQRRTVIIIIIIIIIIIVSIIIIIIIIVSIIIIIIIIQRSSIDGFLLLLLLVLLLLLLLLLLTISFTLARKNKKYI